MVYEDVMKDDLAVLRWLEKIVSCLFQSQYGPDQNAITGSIWLLFRLWSSRLHTGYRKTNPENSIYPTHAMSVASHHCHASAQRARF